MGVTTSVALTYNHHSGLSFYFIVSKLGSMDSPYNPTGNVVARFLDLFMKNDF